MRNQLGVFHFRVVEVQRLATYDALSWFQHAIHVFDVVARTRQRIPVLCAFGVQRHGRCFMEAAPSSRVYSFEDKQLLGGSTAQCRGFRRSHPCGRKQNRCWGGGFRRKGGANLGYYRRANKLRAKYSGEIDV